MYMVDTAVYLGTDRVTAEMEMQRALDLEIVLAKISKRSRRKRRRSSKYNRMSVKELSVLYPALPWVKYINTILFPHKKASTITEKEVVNVAVLRYIKKLSALITKSPSRDIANLIMWRNIEDMMPFLTGD